MLTLDSWSLVPACLALAGALTARWSGGRRPRPRSGESVGGQARATSVAGPPRARQVPSSRVEHGVRLDDPYHWLRDREDPATLAYLEAENGYTEEVLRGTRELRETLYREMLARIREDDTSVPVRRGPWLYYRRSEAGRAHPIHCRRRAEDGAEEQILLDLNELVEDEGDYLGVGVVEVSPDHRLLAFSVDLAGDEAYTLRLKDLESGELLPEEIPGTSDTLAWANDGRTLFYTTLDGSRRPWRAHRHRVGEGPEADELVLEEPDDAFHLRLSVTRSRGFVVFELASNTTTEVHTLPADRPADRPTLFAARRRGIEYEVDHRGDWFYVRTNDEAREFRLLRSPVAAAGGGEWSEVVPHRPAVQLEAVELFRDRTVLVERAGGLRRLRVWDERGGEARTVPLAGLVEEDVYHLRPDENPEFDARGYRFRVSSLVTPPTVLEVPFESDPGVAPGWTARPRVLEVEEVGGGYDPGRYRTERITATSADGTSVPVSLVHRRDRPRDGSGPCLLSGYGAYGLTMEPGFRSALISLLDRGFVFAIAHVRGGGLLGEAWHDDGKMEAKGNTFDDFIAVAEHLVAAGYTSADRLCLRGGSAGGLLVGTVLNRRPELFRAAVAVVPFVDVMNTMLDPAIPLTVIEYEEWGDPRREEEFRAMLSYSPYDNVADREYPDLLVTAGLNDPRVQYWEPAKWVARLRATAAEGGLVLLRTNMEAGHQGASGRYGRLRERAFEYAFLLDRVGAADG